MSKQDDMRRLIDLANGKKTLTESQSVEAGSAFKSFKSWSLNEGWFGEPASEPTSIDIWQDKDPLGRGEWFWTRAVDGHVVARGGECATEEEARHQATGGEVEEDMLAEPNVLDEDDFHNDNTESDDEDAAREEIAGLVKEGFFSGSGGGIDGARRFVWSLELDSNDDPELEHVAYLISEGYVEGQHPTWKLFLKMWHDSDFGDRKVAGLEEEDFEGSYFDIDEKEDLSRIAWLIHSGQDHGFAPEWHLIVTGSDVPSLKDAELNAIAQEVRGGTLEGMLHTGEKWTVTADLDLNLNETAIAPRRVRPLPKKVSHKVANSPFVGDMGKWQAGDMDDTEMLHKWDGRKKLTKEGEEEEAPAPAPKKMDMERAIDILGISRTRDGDLKNMIKALGSMSMFNSDQENERLAAAQFIVRRWSAYQAACAAARGMKFKIRESDDEFEEYENEPDDGHEHEWVEPDYDTGVDNAVICTRCGELSVDDEHEHEHEHDEEFDEDIESPLSKNASLSVHDRLAHAVTAYDRGQMNRNSYNPNALGIYLGRVESIAEKVEAGADLADAIRSGFTDRLRDYVLKAMGCA